MTNPYYQGPNSDHFDGERFFREGSRTDKTSKELLRWLLGSDRSPWPKHVDNPPADPVIERIKEADNARITFIGHATFLIQTAGLNILTDPFFSDRASPFQWVGPKRVRSPGLPLTGLPPIDLILLSHNHYDHLDRPALKWLIGHHDPQIITPLGNAALVPKTKRISEHDWGDKISVGAITVCLTPAQHWSRRTFQDRNWALWSAFHIQIATHLSVYFAADTGYGGGEHFRVLRQEFGSPDMALLPVGAYEPRWFMKAQHMNPDEAVRAHLNLGASRSIAMHHGTIQLTNESMDAPIEALKQALEHHQVAPDHFIHLLPGMATNVT